MNGESFIRSARPVIGLIVAIWAIEIFNQMLGHRLNLWFGLEPRDFGGLVGIPTMPFLHGGIGHAAANTLPLLVLGAIGAAVAPARFLTASIAIVIVTGLAVWLLARPGIVVGASGLIFGWFGFVIMLGIVERSVRTILGAVVVLVLYGGMIWGVLPEAGSRVSWEAHMFGALAGAVVARLIGKPG